MDEQEVVNVIAAFDDLGESLFLATQARARDC